MFAAPSLKWSEQSIPEFYPKTLPLLLQKLGPAEFHAFLRRRCEWEEPIPTNWRKVHAKPDEKRSLWIVAHRSMREPLGIQTTSIMVHEEGKTDRGALKMVSRETLDDGRFHIIYRGDFREMELLKRDMKAIEESYGNAVLDLVLACGYLTKLLNNAHAVRYLSQNYSDILNEL